MSGLAPMAPRRTTTSTCSRRRRLAALVAKGISGDPTAIPARTALAMATRLGARAMHLGDITGSLEPGKRADLIVVDLDQPHTTPRFTRDANAIYSQLVYAAKSTDVVDAMCDGRWLMRDRRLLTLDEADLQSGADDVARRIDAFLMQREQSVLQKLIAIGGAAEQESFEIQVKARLASEDVGPATRSRATTSRSFARCTTTSTTRTSSSTIPSRAAFAIAKTSSSMSRTWSSTPARG